MFNYRIIYFDPVKNRQEYVDMDNQNIAIFIAKKKVRDGMQDVIIQVSLTGSYNTQEEDFKEN